MPDLYLICARNSIFLLSLLDSNIAMVEIYAEK